VLPVALGMEAATGVFVRLDGWRQAQGRSLRLDGKGVEITLRNRGPMVRWPGKPRCGRCLVGLSFWTEAATGVSFVLLAGGTALDLTLAREALHLPWPSRRRLQRGCSGAHDKDFAGGAVCIELGSPCLCLPDRCASERALRAGVAVDGECAAGWRWTVDRWRWRSVEPAVGAP